MIRARVAHGLVGLLAAALGMLVAGLHLPALDGVVAPFMAAWLVVPVALALEPAPGRLTRTVSLSVAASAVVAAFTLAIAASAVPRWWSLEAEPMGAGLHLVCVAWTGRPLGPWLLLTALLLPAAVAVLLMRRVARQVEWQVAAAALGPALVCAALDPTLGRPVSLWLLALGGAPLGVGAYLVDSVLLGTATLARFPAPALPEEAPLAVNLQRRRAVLLGALLVAGAAWATVWSLLAPRVLPTPVEAGCPDLTPVFEDVRARQEAHRARTGRYASSLGGLEGIAPAVAGGYTQEHVLRFGIIDGEWVLTADPVPARLGWPSLRLVGAKGKLERAPRPLSLRRRR